MGAVKINGTTSGSVSLTAPASGSDVTLTLPGSTMDLATELASKLPIAGGKILQIVRATDGTLRTTTSTSFTDASLSLTITPQYSDSAVLLIYSGVLNKDVANESTRIQITDNSNNPVSGAGDGISGTAITTDQNQTTVLIGYATPATTSATTYKLRFRSSTGNTVRLNNLEIGQLYAMEVSA
jgi:hypothetical protein